MSRKRLEDMTLEEMWGYVDELYDRKRYAHAALIKRAIMLKAQGIL